MTEAQADEGINMKGREVERCPKKCPKHNKECVVGICNWKEKSAFHIVDCRDTHKHICAECIREELRKCEEVHQNLEQVKAKPSKER